MPRGRSYGRAIARGPRRGSSWVASSIENSFTVLAAATAILDQLLIPAAVTSIGGQATVVRTRGLLIIESDSITATENPFGALGMAIVTEQAAAAGIASVPKPYADADQDQWFVWVPFGVAQGVIGGASLDGHTAQYVIDSKAMRKVEEGDAVVVVIENADAVGGLEYNINFRMLFKLS